MALGVEDQQPLYQSDPCGPCPEHEAIEGGG
jgi:hypothetical protein